MKSSIVTLLASLAIIASLVPARSEPVTVVAFGDSLTAGYGLAAAESFPAKLELALKAKGLDVIVVNAGVSGDTSRDGLARLDWSIDDKADAVIVELGANDMLRGFDPSVTRTALDQILARLTERKLPVLVAGMRATPSLGPDYVAAFDPIFKELAETHGALYYPFFLEGIAGTAGLNQNDGMHPTAAGIDIIVTNILPMVEELIRRVAAKS